jgi:hypothetical protein
MRIGKPIWTGQILGCTVIVHKGMYDSGYGRHRHLILYIGPGDDVKDHQQVAGWRDPLIPILERAFEQIAREQLQVAATALMDKVGFKSRFQVNISWF